MRSARTIEPVDLLAVLTVAVVIIVVVFYGVLFSGKEDDFARFASAKRACSERPNEVSVALVGDVMLSRDVAKKMSERDDPAYPFIATRDFLKTADIAFGNLESPIAPGRGIATHEMVFRADPGVEAALANSGFTAMSIANNHVFDFGAEGLRETVNRLQNVGILAVGAGFGEHGACKPVYIERKGVRFALLACCDDMLLPRDERGRRVVNFAALDTGKMGLAINEAKKRADIVIVSMHAGIEYNARPDSAQIVFARAAIDAGADLVVGHHPHVVQRFERYKGKYILYSLGNFVFDQMWSQATREGLIAKAVFDGDKLTRIELVPVIIEDFAQPKPLYGARADAIIERAKTATAERRRFAWNTEVRRVDVTATKAIYAPQDHKPEGLKVLKTLDADLNENGLPERYSLRDGELKVTEGSRLIWSTPANWWVDDFALADSTGDGATNINMSVWKAGNFGTTRPFWLEKNDQSIKNHFFVFAYRDGEVKPVWQSSNLDKPNREFLFEDIDDDDRRELVVIEGDYADENQAVGRYVAVWRWDEWGFFNEWRSEPGRYRNLTIEKAGGRSHIVVDVADTPHRQGRP